MRRSLVILFFTSFLYFSCKPEDGSSSGKVRPNQEQKVESSKLPFEAPGDIPDLQSSKSRPLVAEESFTDSEESDYERILNLPKSERRGASSELVDNLLEKGDWNSVLGFLQVLPSGGESKFIFLDALSKLAVYDPRLIFRETDKLRANLTQGEYNTLIENSSRIIARDGEYLSTLENIKSADQFSDAEKRIFRSQIIRHWAKRDSTEIENFVLNLPFDDYQFELLPSTLRYLDLQSSEVFGLLDDVIENRDDVSRLSSSLSSMIGNAREISKEEKVSLFTSYDQLFSDKQRDEFAYETFVSWGKINLDEALTSLDLIKEPHVQKKVVRRLFYLISEHDPESAVEWKAWIDSK